MTTVRLTATASELRARARSRARGEMAALAGDDIVGATEASIQEILSDGRPAQELSSLADDLLLDTTGLTAADSARMVLDLITT